MLECLECINGKLDQYLPDGISVSAFAEYEGMLPYSPTTLKKDRNKMAKKTEGYIRVEDGNLKAVSFRASENGYYRIDV